MGALGAVKERGSNGESPSWGLARKRGPRKVSGNVEIG